MKKFSWLFFLFLTFSCYSAPQPSYLAEHRLPSFKHLDIRCPYNDELVYYKLPTKFTKFLVKLKVLDRDPARHYKRADDVVGELNAFRDWQIQESESNYLHLAYPERFYPAIDYALSQVCDKPLKNLTKQEAIVALSQVLRYQIVGSEKIDSLVREDLSGRVIPRLDSVSIFDLMTLDEYFLAGSGLTRYYCGYTSWLGVFIFNHWKKSAPSLADLELYEVSIQGPGHSLNLLVEHDNNSRLALCLVDFLPEQFWKTSVPLDNNSPDLLGHIDVGGSIKRWVLGKM